MTAAAAYGYYETGRFLNNVFNENTTSNNDGKDKRHTPDQEALSDIVKDSGKRKFSDTEADTLLEWAEEYNFPGSRDDRDTEIHWKGGKHIHLNGKHIPVL